MTVYYSMFWWAPGFKFGLIEPIFFNFVKHCAHNSVLLLIVTSVAV